MVYNDQHLVRSRESKRVLKSYFKVQVKKYYLLCERYEANQNILKP